MKYAEVVSLLEKGETLFCVLKNPKEYRQDFATHIYKGGEVVRFIFHIGTNQKIEYVLDENDSVSIPAT